MGAATADITTTYSGVNQLSLKVAGGAVIHAGTMVSVNSSGYAIPAANTDNSKDVTGIARESVDATGLADGIETVVVIRHHRFKIKNSATSALTQANLFGIALVENDQTVAATASKSNVAGKLVGLDGDFCWVEIPG